MLLGIFRKKGFPSRNLPINGTADFLISTKEIFNDKTNFLCNKLKFFLITNWQSKDLAAQTHL